MGRNPWAEKIHRDNITAALWKVDKFRNILEGKIRSGRANLAGCTHQQQRHSREVKCNLRCWWRASCCFPMSSCALLFKIWAFPPPNLKKIASLNLIPHFHRRDGSSGKEHLHCLRKAQVGWLAGQKNRILPEILETYYLPTLWNIRNLGCNPNLALSYQRFAANLVKLAHLPAPVSVRLQMETFPRRGLPRLWGRGMTA